MSATTVEHSHDVITGFLEDAAATVHDQLGDVAGVAASTVDAGSPRILAASNPLAAAVDRVQFDVGTGPCLEAFRTGDSYYVADLERDERWGDYGPRAAALGVASCLSLPVLVDAEPVAVFKVYAGRVDGLSEDQQTIARRKASELTGGFTLARHLTRQAVELDDRAAAMLHRRVIDLALGITMERAQVSADTAFDLLRQRSQDGNQKLHDVAAQVVRSVPGGTSADLWAPYAPRHD